MTTRAGLVLILASATGLGTAAAQGTANTAAGPTRAEVARQVTENLARQSPAERAADRAFNLFVIDRRYAEADAAIEEALAAAAAEGWTDARRAPLLLTRAEVRHATGRYAGAREDLDQALPHATAGDVVRARTLLIEVARAMGDFRAASETLRSFGPAVLNPAAAGEAQTVRAAGMTLQRYNFFLAEAKNRRAWGDLQGAREMFELAVARENTSSEILRELARCLLAANEPAAALQRAHEALYLALHTRGTSRRRPRTSWIDLGDAEVLACLQVAADCARAAGDAAAADAHFETAITLARKLNLPGDARLAELGRARGWIGSKDARAASVTSSFLSAIVTETAASAEPRVRIEAATLAGELAFVQGRPAQAVEFLETAVTAIEAVRATASFEEKRTYLALQADSYRRLVAAHIRLKQPEQALLAAESLKARQLLELLQPGSATSTRTEDRLASLRELQRRLPADVAAISYANADWSQTPPAAIIITREAITAIELSAGRIRLALEFLPQAAILEAQRRDVDAVRYGSSNEITLGGLIAYYRECLDCPPDQIAVRIEPMLAVGKVLNDVLIEPLRPALDGRKRLLIAPSGLLAYLPFDTLVTAQGNMLVNDHAITLTPSLLTTMVLAARAPATYERPILAFGGAIYDPSSYSQDMVASDRMKEQFSLMLAAREAAFAPNRSPYAGVFGGPMNNLAGTKAEVQMLGELLPEGRIMLGEEVRETRIQALAAEGEFKKSRVIHFAVHGASLPQLPELSCIALSYEGHYRKDMPAGRDGLLQLSEIQALPLRAELVTLSACQTGLGAIFAGEGVVGLTSAFLTAGSNRVLASLWPVNDASTTFFMQHFYRRHVIEGEAGDLAMAEVKREFLAGRVGGFRHPQFWAPFNLYGGADLLEPAPL
ncbi:MAG TPA: CHAT domain-containing protein [Opitutaceae bacterium]